MYYRRRKKLRLNGTFFGNMGFKIFLLLDHIEMFFLFLMALGLIYLLFAGLSSEEDSPVPANTNEQRSIMTQ